ncbi:MAG: hypothetical protein OXT65_13040 [Alphaproteobacteria bacterium]|nr:hypothetical protein [Alphaproteobacteria bacterium]
MVFRVLIATALAFTLASASSTWAEDTPVPEKNATVQLEAKTQQNDVEPVKIKAPKTCQIRGLVRDVHEARRTVNGIPSPLAPVDVLVTMYLKDRNPRNSDTKDEHSCTLSKETATKSVVYKLCSPTRPKSGDIILATEGAYLLDPKSPRCLFDLVVMPRKTKK